MLSAAILVFVIQGNALKAAVTLDPVELARTSGDLVRSAELT
jgi:hypothetical protein